MTMAFRLTFFTKNLVYLIFITLCISTAHLASAQRKKAYLASDSFDPTPRGQFGIRLAFYNVENLFDYFDDSTTIDEEFLPRGERYWTKKRYNDKLNKVAKTIIAIGGWEPPALIGLCEIENRYVLEGLTKFTQLKSLGYEIVHQDSRDRRGIDVAALYRPEKFRLLNYEFYRLKFPFDTASKTRDILHVTGLLSNQDTLHYFVNHWPSKFGGVFETKPKRVFAANFVRQKADSLLNLNPEARIIITGDFNDEPEEESITEGLNITKELNQVTKTSLFNLMYSIRFLTGTHSFENRWSILDQFIVSGNLLNKTSTTRIHKMTAVIFDMNWLIIEGATGATRPFRTYQGPKYLGGYSDHLPIYLDLVLK